jgi:hypothetical protein
MTNLWRETILSQLALIPVPFPADTHHSISENFSFYTGRLAC